MSSPLFQDIPQTAGENGQALRLADIFGFTSQEISVFVPHPTVLRNNGAR